MTERIASILWIVLSSLLCVGGQTLAKLGLSKLALGTPRAGDFARMLASPLVWAGGLLLVAGTLVWFLALSKTAFSIALPISCLLMLVLSVAIGVLCFGEAVPVTRGVGLALALAAVWLIAR
jgi:drug/metabolite transporter (DMT)-like permease